jgi:hypothetical protein
MKNLKKIENEIKNLEQIPNTNYHKIRLLCVGGLVLYFGFAMILFILLSLDRADHSDRFVAYGGVIIFASSVYFSASQCVEPIKYFYQKKFGQLLIREQIQNDESELAKNLERKNTDLLVEKLKVQDKVELLLKLIRESIEINLQVVENDSDLDKEVKSKIKDTTVKFITSYDCIEDILGLYSLNLNTSEDLHYTYRTKYFGFRPKAKTQTNK